MRDTDSHRFTRFIIPRRPVLSLSFGDKERERRNRARDDRAREGDNDRRETERDREVERETYQFTRFITPP